MHGPQNSQHGTAATHATCAYEMHLCHKMVWTVSPICQQYTVQKGISMAAIEQKIGEYGAVNASD